MYSPHGKLLAHLPAIYQDCKDLAKLLEIFEGLLLGPGKTDAEGEGSGGVGTGEKALAERIASVPLIFDPLKTPNEFVPWLSRWVALSGVDGPSLEQERKLLSRIVPLYAKRGTREYMEKLLDFYTPEGSVIGIVEEGPAGFRIGEAAVGITTQFGGDRPYWFAVHVRVASHEKSRVSSEKLEQRIRRVIDLAKPAHTLYELNLEFE